MKFAKVYSSFKNIIKPGGGWRGEGKEDSRNFQFFEAFKDLIFGGTIPEEFIRGEESLPRIPRQGRTLACVSATFTFINSWYSKLTGNDVILSWPDLFSRVPLLDTGTRASDNMKELKNNGQCEDYYLPEKTFISSAQARDRSKILDGHEENRKKYRIQGYFNISTWNKAEIKTAIMKAPIAIGVYSNYNQWQQGTVIKYDGWKQWGHFITLIGWTKEYWIIVDSMLGAILKLDINHPIESAKGIFDLPDNYLSNTMKILKTEDKPEIWCVLPNGKRFHILNMNQFDIGERQGQWTMKDLKTVTQTEIEHYPIEENPPVFLA